VAAAVAVSVAAVALFLGGIAYYNTQLRLAARKSQAAEAAAMERFKQAFDAFNEMVFGVQERLGNTAATRSARQALLATAISGLHNIAKGNEASAPNLSRAVAHVKLGEIYLQIGRMTDARRQLEQAQMLARNLAKSRPNDLAVAECLRNALAGLGAVAVHHRRLDDAKALLRQVVALSERIAQGDPSPPHARRGRIEAYLELGRAHAFAGERREAESSFRKMQELAERWVADEPHNLSARDLLASSYRKLADERKLVNDDAAARVHYLKALDIARDVHDAEPDNVVFTRHLATAADDLAGVAQIQGQTDEARSLFQEAQRLFAQQVAADPEDAESQFRLLRVETRFGTLERDELQFARASELFQHALDGRLRLDPEHHFGPRLGRKGPEVYLLETEIAACAIASRAISDLQAARTQSPAVSCLLLWIRSRAMRKAGLQTDALAAAAALCDLKVDTVENLYVKARSLAGCVRELDDQRWAAPANPARQAMRRRCAEGAIAVLAQAIGRGLDNSPISGFEEDLAPLRGEPGYQELADRLRDPTRHAASPGTIPPESPRELLR
jgi:tetratricopeptide (TPR) repeat protein